MYRSAAYYVYDLDGKVVIIMTGKGHLVTGVSCLAISDCLLARVSDSLERASFLHNTSIFSVCRNWLMNVWVPGGDNIVIHGDTLTATGGAGVVLVYVCWALYFMLFLLGNLLPDIDSEKSMLGRFIYLPVKHHRITHTVWFMLPFLIGGIWLRPLFWIGLGYFCHLFIDSLGRAGNCWLYPLSQYVEYDSGAFVKKGHVLKLYRTGDITEVIWCCIFALLAICLVVMRLRA